MVLNCNDKYMDPTQNPDLSASDNTSWFWPLIISMGVFLILFIVTIVWSISLVPKKTAPVVATPQFAPISGVVDFDGYASKEAYLAISERKAGKEKDFKDVLSGLVPTSGTIPWVWKQATPGQNYELKAVLKTRGNVVESSGIVLVSAPASSVSIRLVSEQIPPNPQPATISGTIDLKGYLPPGATVNILAKSLNAVSFANVASVNPSDNAVWSWNGAAIGQTYDMKAQIQSADGTVISSENPVIVTAPSNSQVLEAESTAKSPAPITSGISGNININGTIPSNAYITLATRPSGTTTFNQVASNISAANGASWNWTSATSGNSYDVQAYLWANGKPFAQSQILTINAPSTYEVLTINAEVQLPAPSLTSFNISCGNNIGGQFQVNFNYNTQANLTNPQSYNLVITSGSGGTQSLNTTVTPASPGQSQALTTTAIVQPGATYYAQYSYAQCTNCNNFSPMSPPIQFACR